MPLVSISNDQRKPVANCNFVATVHHGLPADLLKPIYSPRGGYLAFLGRCRMKSAPIALSALHGRSGCRSRWPPRWTRQTKRISGSSFRRSLSLPGIEFLGEINERRKNEFLGEAHALLFPVDWPEPFGLVMVEAMACGTPVLAFRRGSVPEM